jgi:hypothetical protein
MGSFALQEAILDHSAVYAGAVLSGSTAVDLLAARLTEAGGAFNRDEVTAYVVDWLDRHTPAG